MDTSTGRPVFVLHEHRAPRLHWDLRLEDRTERRFVFVLHGRGQARRYALIDTGSDWLLHLTRDQPPG